MDLKNGMVIKCNSEKEAKEFIKEAYKQGFKWFSNYHEGDEEKTCWGCVCDFNSEIYYHLEADEIIWSSMYSGNESIEYSTLKEKIKTMTKSDLKNGMVVELRNGKRFLIVNDLGIGEDSCITLDGFMGYDENLNDIMRYSEFDITKIYKTEGNTFKTLFDNERLSLIWEREEKQELSKEDKQIIKKGLKKIQEECKSHKYCVGCIFDDKTNDQCLLNEIDDLEVDKLFEE